MADIKTELRELSVATTIGLLNSGIQFTLEDLHNPQHFFKYTNIVVSNYTSNANNLTDYVEFPDNLKIIIDNGYKLGKKIYNSPHFNFKKNVTIQWLGNDTQKEDPIDITIGNYGFSLKEESFILKNMGLYQLLNSLTGSNYRKGLHIFQAFAHKEYEEWFSYTWGYFCEYLRKNSNWEFYKKSNVSKAFIEDSHVVLDFNGQISKVPVTIASTEEYMQHTSSKTREKVFSKWINEIFSDDENYIKLKKICSETAGRKISKKIQEEYKPDNLYDFFQIHTKEYYYAKTTPTETTILRVPSRNNFTSVIEFIQCTFNVPSSQLNIITQFQNKHTKKILEFRNECRFTHGQFNGTPEAKMYVVRNTPLIELYAPLI